MAEKSDDDSDHGDDASSQSIVQQIKRLEKEKADLEKRNSERNLLQEKLKELQGTVSSLKSAPINNNVLAKSPSKSPGSGRGKGKGKKNSPAPATSMLQFVESDLLAQLDNRRTRSKSKTKGRSDAAEEDSDPDSEDDSDNSDTEKRQERVMSTIHKQRLQEHRDTLVENMISEDIFNDLISNRILTTADVGRIKEKNTREAINEELLNNLIRRSDRAFTVFVSGLRKTLQGYLADLVEDKTRQKKRKLKRPSAEMNVSLDVDEVVPRRKRKPSLCTCQQVEEQMLLMAKNAFGNIRRRDATPASFEQFKKELGQTNTIIKDSMEIMHTLKILCRHGDIEEVTFGSVKFKIRFTSVKKLTNLWRLFRCGKLLDIFQMGFVTKDILEQFDARHIRLGLRIDEEEYLQCLTALGGTDTCCPSQAKWKYSRVADLQENIIPQDILSPQAQLSPLDVRKSFPPNTPTSGYDLTSSDPGPKRIFRELHRNIANSLTDLPSKTSPLTTKPSQLSHNALHMQRRSMLNSTRLRSHLSQDSRQRTKIPDL